MLKVYEIWRESGIDYEGDSAYIIASYSNKKSADEHLACIEKELRAQIESFKHEEFQFQRVLSPIIDDYVPGDHIYGGGFSGDYDRWTIVERDILDKFTPSSDQAWY